MNYLTIKQKLILIMIIPFLGLLYFSISSLIIKNENLQYINKFEKYLEFSKKANLFIHELQIERGLTAGFIGKNGKIFKNKLTVHRKSADKLYDNLKEYIVKNKLFFDKYINHLIKKERLIDFRKSVDKLDVSHLESMEFYTKEIESLLYSISKITLLSKDFDISTQSVGLLNLIYAKEYAGQERAIVNNIFSSETFTNKTFIKISTLNSKFNAHISLFKDTSDKESLNYFYKHFRTKDVYKFKQMQNFIYTKIYKNEIVSKLKATAGYGGLIHNFKNYLLRGDIKYKNKFLEEYKILKNLINQYKQYNITKEEIELLTLVQKTFTNYKSHLNNISNRSKDNIKNIDKEVIVDDFPAINALNILETKIIGVDSNEWFTLASNRIDILKEVEKILTQKLLIMKNNSKQELVNSLFYQKLFFTIFIILYMILFFLIYKDIITKLNTLQNGLISFLKFVTKKERKYKLLNISGVDEFSTISKVLNKSMKQTAIHIQEEIKLASQQEIQIQESTKMAQMGEMIGNIAHQWRQPLSVISTSASGMMIEKEYNILSDEKFNLHCENILTNSDLLSETIDIFRDITTEKKELKKVIIQDRINIALKVLSSTLENYNIKLINNINYTHPIELTIMVGELSQVIINILNNSKDILVERKVKTPWIKIDCIKENNIARITIEDNAGGISEDIISKIFDPYFTTKHQSQGRGLGLHLSYKIIFKNLHGKLYTINSKNGAVFYIELPLN